MAVESLFQLLGLTSDVSPARLRYVYEGAVSAATARGDWARIAQLSSAFDALPKSARVAVYSGRDRDASRWEQGETRGRKFGLPSKSPAVRHAGAGTGVRSVRRQRYVLLALSAAVGIGSIVTWIPHLHDAERAAPPSYSGHTAQASSGVVQPTEPHVVWQPIKSIYPARGEIVIPADAIVDRRGRARVKCPTTASGSSWRIMSAEPGQVFTCPSGMVGLVRMPAG